MRISDWSSDVCSSDLYATALSIQAALKRLYRRASVVVCFSASNLAHVAKSLGGRVVADHDESGTGERAARETGLQWRSEEHTSELQSLMRTSYAVFCLK